MAQFAARASARQGRLRLAATASGYAAGGARADGSYTLTLDRVRHDSLIKQLSNLRESIAEGDVDFWNQKVEKLAKVIEYMKKKNTIPAVINLTNSKNK